PPTIDTSQYGHGHCTRVPKNANVANHAHEAFILDSAGSLKPSKVFINTSNAEWYQDIMEHALALSEDEPSIKDALSGDEKED
ncbi:hypothetical protein H0H87_006034, partial [Tephrocybe sp. NHM501043]